MPLATPDLLGLARQSLPLGEIRTGASKEIPGKKARQPVRLETLRFTTPNQDTADAVGEHFGGTPAPWDRRRGYWVVDTDVARIDVWVPPRGLAVDTNMEMWGGSPVKNLRWCNGKIERRSGQPCMCPMPDDPDDPDDVQRAYDERQRLAKLGRACSVRTRYNLSIPKLPGLVGVWKLITGSANAARWSADCGEILQRARAAGGFLPASLEITWWPGQDGNPYPVPILRPKQSAVQLAAGELPPGLNGLLQQLTPGGGNGNGSLALTAGTPPAPAAETTPARDTQAPEAAEQPGKIAERIARLIPLAKTRNDVGKLIGQAKAAQVLDVAVWYADGPECAEIEQKIRDLLDIRWWQLPGPLKGAREQQAAPPPVTGDSASLFDDDPSWESPAAGGR